MNKIQFLLILGLVYSPQVLAAKNNTVKSPLQPSIIKPCNPDEAVGSALSPSELEKNVEEAMEAIKAKSPQVHEDSLMVFKNFKAHSKGVNWTYRSWARSLVVWLRDEKDMVFDTREKVGEVFKVLWRKGLISKNAVVLLMNDAWSYLGFLEGSPSWEKSMEEKKDHGRNGVLDSNKMTTEKAV